VKNQISPQSKNHFFECYQILLP